MTPEKKFWRRLDAEALAQSPDLIRQELEAEAVRIFPTIAQRSFRAGLLEGWLAVAGGKEAGILLTRNPIKALRNFGEREVILAVWNDYRKRGIARWMIENLPSAVGKCFALVSNANRNAYGLFAKSPNWTECHFDEASLFLHDH